MFPAKFVLTLANFSTRCSLRLLAFLFALFEQTKAKEDCKCSASLSSCQNPFGNSLTLGFLSLSPLRHDHVKKCKLPRLTAHKCLVFCFVNCKATSHLQSCPIILIFFSSIYLKWYVLKKIILIHVAGIYDPWGSETGVGHDNNKALWSPDNSSYVSISAFLEFKI